MKRKRGKKRGYLVKGYLPPISRDILELEFFRNKIGEILKGNSGVYALYKDKDLYYVGITSKDLFWRLHQHTRGKHKNKWNMFSVFIISKGGYLHDIEGMLQRISEPPANVWKSKFKEHYQHDEEIKRMLKETAKLIKRIQRKI